MFKQAFETISRQRKFQFAAMVDESYADFTRRCGQATDVALIFTEVSNLKPAIDTDLFYFDTF
jgi:hypothetical protein